MSYAYRMIADDIVKRIRRGEWKEGEKIPALNALERHYPQSRMTLYKALRYLTERGHLHMVHGLGTFVKASEPRLRIGILASRALFRQGLAPFAFQAFRHAHAFFSRVGMDSQLYAEDPIVPAGLPSGLREELERGKLAGLLTVDAGFPRQYMATPQWRERAIPHVNIGALPAPYRVYVDHEAFIRRAAALAHDRKRRCAALLEKEEHLAGHRPGFVRYCRAVRLIPWSEPVEPPSPALSFEEYGYWLMRRVWACARKPDAVIVPDDVIAKGIAQAALALGIRAPRELLIVAMTNRDAPIFYPVPVVAMEVDVESIVMKAARLLLDRIKGKPVRPQSILVPPKRVVEKKGCTGANGENT
ncbi:MAG: substrate-binding domain-containing protein [Lentisphaerae bacterium]|nr:substrate-binding domain-containing protein [Lentisphaerota bacterium]